jgi:peptidoglycan/LPS O-acetylase OafA/YrhL
MRFLIERTTGTSAILSVGTRRRRGFAWLSSVLELGDYGARHNKPMEGLRGLAILLVFAVHYFTLAGAQAPAESISARLAALLSSVGNIGVDLFFILSGFLIYGSLIRRRTPFPDYLRRRAQRIYPVFLVVFALYLALSALVPAEDKIPDAPGHALAYIGANLLLLPGIFSIRPMITVAWSLSYEFCFYLLTPVVIGALSLRAWRPASRTTLLTLSSAFLLALSAAGRFPHVRMLGFFAGMMLWETLEPLALGPSPASRWADRIALPLLAAVMLTFTHLRWAPLRALTVTLSFSVLCWACLSGNGLCAQLFRRTPIRWLGNLSYSYYLMHGLALKALFFALARYGVPQAIGGPSVWLLCPLAFFWTLVLTFPVFLFVERPLSLVRGPAPAATPHAAAASVRQGA